ncbi:MsnO8 family LLM class oxidoreductase [Streptomyces sp. NA02950]|uniref:MsnO8 family LLM class oxidoreductase n=1 Tax=Streptomyces sp. NA02950 TaxID=2742137 RepID=UPI001591CC7A|nr:MsnO8 family LLM class oxidoreductase [Streptomyces sp. NA02950]QKV93068.1 MsnO8 family LLM class oxidoreductase [Streptomyces sp. NA02950]
MKLSVVEQAPVVEGLTPAHSLRHSIELARLADRLGYERFWVAEHHAEIFNAVPAPEILIARIAAETSGIRVGSGGVLLSLYSPLKVAEVFRTLHALYPDRIDLGIGRANRVKPPAFAALRNDTAGEAPSSADLWLRLERLRAYLTPDSELPFPVSPQMPGGPTLWLLGASVSSAEAAARLGLPYAYAHFIAPQFTRAALDTYRAAFVPSPGAPSPRPILSMVVCCAETDTEAQRVYASHRLFHRRMSQGDVRLLPPADVAVAEMDRPGPDPLAEESFEWPRYVVGSADRVRDQLTKIADVTGAEELGVVSVIHDQRDRLRSYRLLAEAFELTPR